MIVLKIFYSIFIKITEYFLKNTFLKLMIIIILGSRFYRAPELVLGS